jgi:putative acetyltransferase
VISLARTNNTNPDFQKLINELDRDLFDRYSTGQLLYTEHNLIEALETVVIAYDERLAVGCGCFKKYEHGKVEIKRMFVRTSHRGTGISKLILSELERWAVELGNKIAVLETGKKQTVAISLYKKFGYFPIKNYGPYKNLPQSICFEKKLK